MAEEEKVVNAAISNIAVADDDEEIDMTGYGMGKDVSSHIDSTSLRCFSIEDDSEVDISKHLQKEKFADFGIRKDIQKGIDLAGYNVPSMIQRATLGIVLDSNERLIAQAPTGTGKTAAFVIKMLSTVDETKAAPQALCLVPTAELAHQIAKTVEVLGKKTNVRHRVVGAQMDETAVTEHIVIGTLGTLHRLIGKQIPTDNIICYVIDEADDLIKVLHPDAAASGKKRSDQHQQRAKKQLASISTRLTHPDLQILFFSATYNEDIRAISSTILQTGKRIAVGKEDDDIAEVNPQNIRHFTLPVAEFGDKYGALKVLWQTVLSGAQAIIFVATRKQAQQLADRLTADGHQVGCLQADLDHDQRRAVMADFRRAATKVLVCTDIISRGVDVPAVRVVVNYDMPSFLEAHNDTRVDTYLHRVGRCGRYGRDGFAVSLKLQTDANFDQVTKMVEARHGVKFETVGKERLLKIKEEMEGW
ncbi:DEAD/DEAH box helicase [Carpediemonas membranifera]|uniref:DEAD/DEAH box helicase n=1 Tax=Carpediemonas membranifera TaxID=201153 RepID=A0A8J6BB98_9EUKA|nr:DEAD/DEAH box helicase [Carpediemonas membranifera]|eukprot:KAG9393762.1 DEAD/DEAH box helicase [Carpediemonas membranifera]